MSDLASRLADDQDSAWAELYDATAHTMFAYVTAFVGDRDSAADVLQEAFLRLHRTRSRLRDVDDLNAFVFTVVRNEANRALTRIRTHAVTGEIGEPAMETDSRSQVISANLIQHAMAFLSPEERELIQMKVFAQMTFVQIAAVLDVPMGTCTSRYRRSLEKMRTILQEQVG